MASSWGGVRYDENSPFKSKQGFRGYFGRTPLLKPLNLPYDPTLKAPPNAPALPRAEIPEQRPIVPSDLGQRQSIRTTGTPATFEPWSPQYPPESQQRATAYLPSLVSPSLASPKAPSYAPELPLPQQSAAPTIAPDPRLAARQHELEAQAASFRAHNAAMAGGQLRPMGQAMPYTGAPGVTGAYDAMTGKPPVPWNYQPPVYQMGPQQLAAEEEAAQNELTAGTLAGMRRNPNVVSATSAEGYPVFGRQIAEAGLPYQGVSPWDQYKALAGRMRDTAALGDSAAAAQFDPGTWSGSSTGRPTVPVDQAKMAAAQQARAQLENDRQRLVMAKANGVAPWQVLANDQAERMQMQQSQMQEETKREAATKQAMAMALSSWAQANPNQPIPAGLLEGLQQGLAPTTPLAPLPPASTPWATPNPQALQVPPATSATTPGNLATYRTHLQPAYRDQFDAALRKNPPDYLGALEVLRTRAQPPLSESEFLALSKQLHPTGTEHSVANPAGTWVGTLNEPYYGSRILRAFSNVGRDLFGG